MGGRQAWSWSYTKPSAAGGSWSDEEGLQEGELTQLSCRGGFEFELGSSLRSLFLLGLRSNRCVEQMEATCKANTAHPQHHHHHQVGHPHQVW